MKKLRDMTDAELDQAADRMERIIGAEQDWKKLPLMNMLFQSIIEEQARRDVQKENAHG